MALDLALAHPGRVHALVLVAAALTGFEGSPELDAFDEEEDALLDAGKICEHDQPDFRRLGERLATAIPGAERVAMTAGHLPALEQPEDFNRLVLDFLRRAVF